jgi:hypothetical protein
MTSKDLQILPYLCSKETKGVIYWREGWGGVVRGVTHYKHDKPNKERTFTKRVQSKLRWAWASGSYI